MLFKKDFKHMKSYYFLYRQHNVGAVILKLIKKDYNYWGIVKTIIICWDDLKVELERVERSFIYKITYGELKEDTFNLNCLYISRVL